MRERADEIGNALQSGYRLQEKLTRARSALIEREAACLYYEECLLSCEADDVAAFFGWPGREYQSISDDGNVAKSHRADARKQLAKSLPELGPWADHETKRDDR